MNLIIDKGCFKIYYRDPVSTGNRLFLSTRTATLMDAVAEFNLIKGGFDTPLRVERYNFDGKLTDVFTMDGRYDVPRRKDDAYSLDLVDRMGI
jgi:hypothetical protein